MFSDSTVRILQVPSDTDSFLYLGSEFMSVIYSINKGTVSYNSLLYIFHQKLHDAYIHFSDNNRDQTTSAIKWCGVGHAEAAKCDNWAINSIVPDSDTSAIECQSAPTVEECFKKIMVNITQETYCLFSFLTCLNRCIYFFYCSVKKLMQ